MFGRFLELGIATPDIAASVQFYERLGFTQLLTGDAWPHRYGVLSDGRISLGLHERDMPSPSLCFVLPDLARARTRLAMAHIEPGGLPTPFGGGGGGGGGGPSLIPESTLVASLVIVGWLLFWTAIGAWRMMTRDA